MARVSPTCMRPLGAPFSGPQDVGDCGSALDIELGASAALSDGGDCGGCTKKSSA